MTARANKVTQRATAGAARLVRAADLLAFVAAFEPLGYDREALLGSVDPGALDADDPDARVPCEVYAAVVGSALRQRFTPNLALRVAMNTPMGAYALLDYLVLTCDDVAASARQLSRYLRIVGTPVELDIDDRGNPVHLRLVGGDRFASEFTASLMVLHLRGETAHRLQGVRVHLAHRPDDVEQFARALECDVIANAGWTGLTLPADTWRVPLRRRDPALRAVLERHANAVMEKAASDGSIASRVRAVLGSEVVGEPDTRIGVVSRRLAMSRRTLQRRLAAEGVAFLDVLDEWRKDAARHHLANPAVGICDVAYLLGYSEPAAFHRAFKRWYGTTPFAYRRGNGGHGGNGI
jgi:AraC-like DNA-binding protein